ncbi:Crp/Fnr family transcriptional regulator [Tabrizicola sp. TH137]|uniref:Crp/Fnr family transcriptional regulator n=1 Tax=Tabrizicola sp. TH137 TaxID=2067452 RepID=UPI000C79F6BE|nr:Crp/Fnr family transcriptional regulator [Tabrizicola sp. TH137]PLL11197.1 Crp/Fnr family transcriptional regulator [Tabrizicola sp. TH137]
MYVNDSKIALIGLSALGRDVVDFIRPHMSAQHFQANSVIYFQNDPTHCIYFLTRGYVRLSYIGEDGVVTLHSIVPPGRSFGEAGAFDGEGFVDTAFTATQTEVMVLNLGWLNDTSPPAARMQGHVARLIGRRLRDHMEFTRALYRPVLMQRLSHSLLRLLDLMGNEIRFRGAMYRCLGPVVTQRDLGSMARGTRENVNKMLRKWHDEGILALEDRHIIVLDEDRLRNLTLSEA